MTEPTRQDDVVARYHAAQAELDADPQSNKVTGPSAQVRANILAYAAQLANQRSAGDTPRDASVQAVSTPISPDLIADYPISTSEKDQSNHLKPAANDSQWKIRAVASIAIFGLSGLLFMQWDRAPAEDQEIALSNARPAPSVATPETASPQTKNAQLADAASKTQAPQRSTERSTERSTDAALAKAPAPEPLAETPAVPSPAPSPAPISARAKPSSKSSDDQNAAKDSNASFEAESDNNRSAAKASGSLKSQAQSAPDSPNAALFAAIRSKDAAALDLALQNGADKNTKTNGTPALTLCVQTGQLGMVRQLLSAGADANALDAQGVSALTHARKRGLSEMLTVLEVAGAR